MDNRIFNVNGHDKDMLAAAIHMACAQDSSFEYNKRQKIAGYYINPEKGLVLLWATNERDARHQKFITPLTPEAVSSMVWEWLASEEAQKIPHGPWDYDMDHDGHNRIGWRAYCEDWGHVGNDPYSIVAIKPVFLWYGK